MIHGYVLLPPICTFQQYACRYCSSGRQCCQRESRFARVHMADEDDIEMLAGITVFYGTYRLDCFMRTFFRFDTFGTVSYISQPVAVVCSPPIGVTFICGDRVLPIHFISGTALATPGSSNSMALTEMVSWFGYVVLLLWQRAHSFVILWYSCIYLSWFLMIAMISSPPRELHDNSSQEIDGFFLML